MVYFAVETQGHKATLVQEFFNKPLSKQHCTFKLIELSP